MNRFLVVILISVSQQLSANKIDSLTTDEDILTFLGTVDKEFAATTPRRAGFLSMDSLVARFKCGLLPDITQLKNWDKVDFDMDGRTDLLTMIHWIPISEYAMDDVDIYVTFDDGNDSFRTIRLSTGILSRCQFAKPIFFHGNAGLLFYHDEYTLRKGEVNILDLESFRKRDTLIYKDGRFIEFNNRTSPKKVKFIEFRTSECFGTCPVFLMRINNDQKAVYHAIKYNPTEGKLKATIREHEFQEITKLIGYLKIDQLKDEYRVGWTDDQTGFLKIHFEDGSIKQIQDYGLIGSFGLKGLYKLLFDLRENQEWKR
jgi:hypothetical protein